jgi:23S rRNA (guanine2445-N2)-methyltransferase / 23S rRNA (guanine2069-N7)-methyltransferase
MQPPKHLTDPKRFFATAPKGIESVLAQELTDLGAISVRSTTAGVSFQGDIVLGYRACLWSRTASRILMEVATFNIQHADDLYDGIRSIDWSDHLCSKATLAVDCQSVQSAITHTHFGALRTKDAIVDQFREKDGERPSVDLTSPDLRIHVHLLKNRVSVYLDLSGQSLHKRGYRLESGLAPLKENLAAAILLYAGWPKVATDGGGLMDPMCGSGTLPLEGALIAADIAPGLMRKRFGFDGWQQHRQAIWDQLLEEARQRRVQGLRRPIKIVGYDVDAAAIRASLTNLAAAGLSSRVHFEKRALDAFSPHAQMTDRPGLVVLNPPYGNRMGKSADLGRLYRKLGTRLRTAFPGWRAALISAGSALPLELGLHPTRENALFNGSLACRLLHYRLPTTAVRPRKSPDTGRDFHHCRNWEPSLEVEMFRNRLRKNLKKLKPWCEREQITCFRAYDRDLPEYAVAIDIYEQWVLVHEYQAPKSVTTERADARLNDILAVLPDDLSVPRHHVFLKIRSRQRGNNQYQRLENERRFHTVAEAPLRFQINFTDYIDTGLFLDQRLTRRMIRAISANKRFLNLFAYTGTATVAAAAGKAVASVSVDQSQIYLDWAQRNLTLNGFTSGSHRFQRADCIEWLRTDKSGFDLIFVDPPSFSNRKQQRRSFDVQRDHVELIHLTAARLNPGGTIIFSNNLRTFKLDPGLTETYQIRDLTAATLSPDFSRRPFHRRCWEIAP